MNIEDTLNNIGDIILLVGLPASLFFFFSYVIRGRKFWTKSLIGILFVTAGFSMVLFQIIVLLSLFLGPDYFLRPFVRIIGYLLLSGSQYFQAVVYEIERRNPGSPLPTPPIPNWMRRKKNRVY